MLMVDYFQLHNYLLHADAYLVFCMKNEWHTEDVSYRFRSIPLEYVIPTVLVLVRWIKISQKKENRTKT